jgi:hypothetical protein
MDMTMSGECHFFLSAPIAGRYYMFWGFIWDLLGESINLAPEHIKALFKKHSNNVLLNIDFFKKCLHVGTYV